jgi:hypothetical protein
MWNQADRPVMTGGPSEGRCGRCIELGREPGDVLCPTRVGYRPPARAGERGPLHPAARLEVLEGLEHLITIQGEPGRDPAIAGAPQQPPGMEHQQCWAPMSLVASPGISTSSA